MGEQLNSDGSVKDPANTGNDYNSTWTLSASNNDTAILQHEFIQFRFVQVCKNSWKIRFISSSSYLWSSFYFLPQFLILKVYLNGQLLTVTIVFHG
jgi:hypothetical protein